MKQPAFILTNGTKVKTHEKLDSPPGFLVAATHMVQRRPSAEGTIAGVVEVVGGHDGDVYWVDHNAGEPSAAYCFTEFELVEAPVEGAPAPEPEATVAIEDTIAVERLDDETVAKLIDPPLEVGDVVMLKSGGIRMTVWSVEEKDGRKMVTTRYSAPADASLSLFGGFGGSRGDTIQHGYFDQRMLTKV